MTSAKQGHTPGPWAAILDGRSKPKQGMMIHKMALVRTISGHTCIDATGSGADYAEDCANARLIASAPDLLADRDALREQIKRIQDALGTGEEGDNLVAVARDSHMAEMELAALRRGGE